MLLRAARKTLPRRPDSGKGSWDTELLGDDASSLCSRARVPRCLLYNYFTVHIYFTVFTSDNRTPSLSSPPPALCRLLLRRARWCIFYMWRATWSLFQPLYHCPSKQLWTRHRYTGVAAFPQNSTDGCKSETSPLFLFKSNYFNFFLSILNSHIVQKQETVGSRIWPVGHSILPLLN